MAIRLAFLLLSLAIPANAHNQTAGDLRDDDRIELDVSFDHEPEELRENIIELLRFEPIWGPFGTAGYHIFPALESGPYSGPPTTIWTNGWGTSLWRDPVTGWPLM